MSSVFRSGILTVAISTSASRSTRPTLATFGSPLPFSTPAALRRSTAAGGVLVMKVKLASANTVMTTGVGRPGSALWVAALNALQNSMMLTPCCPSAGPTGGAGLAWPAGTCSLM